MKTAEYWETKPPQALEHLIEACWFYKPNFAGPKWDVLLPEGIVDVMFNFGAPYFRQIASNSHFAGTWIAKDALIGQRDQLFNIRWPHYTRLLAIRLKAESAHLIMPGMIGQLTNKHIPLTGTPFQPLSLLLHKIPFSDTDSLLSCCFDFLLALSKKCQSQDDELSNVINYIKSKQGDVDIQNMASVLGIHKRKLERKFSQQIGLTPKFYARTMRLHHFIKLEKENINKRLIDPAMDAQYYDQSHLIREFKRFTGQKPSAFFNSPPNIYEPLLTSILARYSRNSD